MHSDGSDFASKPPASTASAREVIELRESYRRMSHEVHALRDTVAVLRAGANALAADNAVLKIENEHLQRLTRAPRQRD